MSYHSDLTLSRARELRKSLTKAERKIWFDSLKFMPVRFRKQHPFGQYILDFYCPKIRLVIEIDGSVHAKDEVIASDEVREKYLKSMGLTVIRFTNDDIYFNLQGVSEIIIQKIEHLLAEQNKSD